MCLTNLQTHQTWLNYPLKNLENVHIKKIKHQKQTFVNTNIYYYYFFFLIEHQ